MRSCTSAHQSLSPRARTNACADAHWHMLHAHARTQRQSIRSRTMFEQELISWLASRARVRNKEQQQTPYLAGNFGPTWHSDSRKTFSVVLRFNCAYAHPASPQESTCNGVIARQQPHSSHGRYIYILYYTYIHTYIHTCMHTYIHTYIHTYTYL